MKCASSKTKYGASSANNGWSTTSENDFISSFVNEPKADDHCGEGSPVVRVCRFGGEIAGIGVKIGNGFFRNAFLTARGR